MNDDKVLQKLVDIEAKIERFVTNEKFDKFSDRVMSTLDKQGVILQRLDQERLFTIERVKRIEADVDRIKLQLKVA